MRDLHEFDRLDYGEYHGDNEARFRLSWLGYNCRREEAEYESNTAALHERVKAAGAEHVYVHENHVYVVIRDESGAFTPAYKALIEAHEELEEHLALNDEDVQGRISDMADEDAPLFRDDAEEIVDGGQAAFDADVTCTTYCGEWCDYDGLSRDEKIDMLSARLAYAAIDDNL